ncbi:hypothetical protein GCM10023174_09390 [Chelativorans composti]|jgi:Uncharacterized archaeal kinase related to aspartokinases, uridylate kinases|uniref:Dihydroneopterin aldolase n=1 Tax=Chelativorans composti TaxID=768533 RepID=A0ABW5DD49_9HYPH|nr:dihydroneopterin aldolase [bacterium SGD-2]
MMTPSVVKVGGSTVSDARLLEWVGILGKSRLPLVIVPGGGPFADQVRRTQEQIGFSDEAAHVMAIQGMDQFGVMLCDLCERFRPARAQNQIQQVLEEGNIPVWLPSDMTVGRRDIPASWNVTSDSLAAWLAGQIGAKALLLIKQVRGLRAYDTVARLQELGIVDGCLKSMLPSGVRLLAAGPDHLTAAARVMERGALPGVLIANAAGSVHA